MKFTLQIVSRFVATQMLESMIQTPPLMRAEPPTWQRRFMTVRTQSPVAEVDTLMAELRAAAARRRAAEHNLQVSKDQLQASKDRLQLAFNATKLAWWQYDPIRRVGWGDTRFNEIFEVPAGEIAIEDPMSRVHRTTRKGFR